MNKVSCVHILGYEHLYPQGGIIVMWAVFEQSHWWARRDFITLGYSKSSFLLFHCLLLMLPLHTFTVWLCTFSRSFFLAKAPSFFYLKNSWAVTILHPWDFYIILSGWLGLNTNSKSRCISQGLPVLKIFWLFLHRPKGSNVNFISLGGQGL